MCDISKYLAYDEDGIQIYCADCRLILPHLPKVDLVLTDPPYDCVGMPGGGFGNNAVYHNSLVRNMIDFDPSDYLLASLKDAVNPYNGVFFGSRDQCVKYARFAADNGLTFDVHFWYKPNAIPFTSGTFKSDVEYIYLVYASGRKITQTHRQQDYSKMFSHPLLTNPKEKYHPTMKPIGAMKKYARLLAHDESTILDPFMGSGTTLVAAKQLGRRAIGIEIEPKYVEIAIKRLAQKVFDFGDAVDINCEAEL